MSYDLGHKLPKLIVNKNYLQVTAEKHKRCVCCLAGDTKFICLKTCRHYCFLEIFYNYAIRRDDLVCLDCHNMLQKIDSFKQQVEESINLFSQVENLTSPKKTLKLQKSNVFYFDNSMEPDIFSAKEHANITIKIESYDLKIERDYSDEQSNTDTNAFATSMPQIKQEPRSEDTDESDGNSMDEENVTSKEVEENKIEIDVNLKSEATTSFTAPPPHVHKSSFACDYCGLVFHWRSLLKRHVISYHSNFKLQCCHCSKVFKHEGTLRGHIDTVHNKKTRPPKPPVECPVCHKMFKGKHTLRVHLKRIHPPTVAQEEERYCVECNKLFKSESYYKLHLKTTLKHATDRYECHDCGKIFTLKSNLMAHMKRVHLGLYRKTFGCTFCGKAFVKDRQRIDHERHIHHGLQRKRDHVCTQCGKGFTFSQTLKRHMVIHSGAKDFHCEFCPMSFNQKATLKSHCMHKHKDLFLSPSGDPLTDGGRV